MRTLTFFLSFSGSLGAWRRAGIIDREILHLAQYLRCGFFDNVNIFSYDAADNEIIRELRLMDPLFQKVELLTPNNSSPPTRTSSLIYSIIGPLRHRDAIRGSSILKTNQISGSWAALIAKLSTGRPLLLRLGYILSRRFRLNGKKKSAQLAAFVEGVGFRFADAIIVTSKAARDEVQARASQKSKVQLVSTYVDTDLFAPRSAPTKSRFLYVGRLTKQKNLESLIRAAQLANVGVDIYGDGPLDDELRTLVRSLKADVEFYPRIPNTQLASVMNDYLFFALPSLHEGLPKVLLEAMSTGLICIGTDIPGTRDLITDGENGFLASGTSEHELLRPIREAVMADRRAIGIAARRLIQEKYGLQRYIDQESEVILGIIK